MTPESVLLALIAALIAALLATGLVLFWRLTSSKGTLSWHVEPTTPDDPWSLRFTHAERDAAMRKHARAALQDDPGPGSPDKP